MSLTKPSQDSTVALTLEHRMRLRQKIQDLLQSRAKLTGPNKSEQDEEVSADAIPVNEQMVLTEPSQDGTVAWTPEHRVRARENIQAVVETPTEVRDSCPSSRSSSPRASRSPSA